MLRALTTVRPGDETVTARPALLSRSHGHACDDRLSSRRWSPLALLVSDEDAAGHVFVRVAHEALLSRWPRASDIVNANRSFLETRARLMADAHRWHSDNRNRELLLPSGKRLAEGEELLLSRREEVDDQVIEYIEASSRAQKEREEKDRQAERALIEAAEAAKRERLEREAERWRARLSARPCGGGGEPARATHALCGHRRDGVGSHGRRRRVLRVQRTTGSNAASGVGATERDKARSAEKEALEARDQALRNQSLSLSFLSQQTAASGDTEAAILLALEALPTSGSAVRAAISL